MQEVALGLGYALTLGRGHQSDSKREAGMESRVQSGVAYRRAGPPVLCELQQPVLWTIPEFAEKLEYY